VANAHGRSIGEGGAEKATTLTGLMENPLTPILYVYTVSARSKISPTAKISCSLGKRFTGYGATNVCKHRH
jgi:hypothetical protein